MQMHCIIAANECSLKHHLLNRVIGSLIAASIFYRYDYEDRKKMHNIDTD